MDDVKIIEVSKDSGMGRGQGTVPTSIPYDPYANVQRLLSEDDMSSPAVQKLLLNENDRMSREIEKIRTIEEKYHSRDKEAAILEEKLKQSTGADVLYTLCEAGGSALVGVSSTFWNNNGWILLIMGCVFILGGILFKFVQR
ncbi:hypothetical protein [uncultured Prevotella sp.]|uniref:hypothetical protein n=1 Tax=uncultured Prevotella sp. TaxID=159272 RepID=UPI0025F9656F|nr:hypothetical protein [uncultured Prevotella sp.]